MQYCVEKLGYTMVDYLHTDYGRPETPSGQVVIYQRPDNFYISRLQPLKESIPGASWEKITEYAYYKCLSFDTRFGFGSSLEEDSEKALLSPEFIKNLLSIDMPEYEGKPVEGYEHYEINVHHCGQSRHLQFNLNEEAYMSGIAIPDFGSEIDQIIHKYSMQVGEIYYGCKTQEEADQLRKQLFD